MRIESPGVARTGKPFAFLFEGRTIGAWPGETLAAALINADIWDWRDTRGGARRGLFCGMGVCGECAVTVDGVQRRACLEPARADIAVARMPALAVAAEVAGNRIPDRLEAALLTPDVMILGAGPAGLAAAGFAAEAGLEVVVVDERAKAGGQYFKQPGTGFAIDGDAVDPQFTEGRARIAEAEQAGARFLFGATLWSAAAGPEFVVAQAGRSITIRPRRAILSPGAFERPHAVPGWTLPGVMTTGAAQTLLRAYQSTPGRRVLVAGHGPLNLQVARELVRAGATVVALAELAAPPWSASPLDLLRMAWAAPGLVAEGLGHLAALRKAGLRPAYRHVMVRAEGDDKVRRAIIARIDDTGGIVAGSERSFEVDSICMGYGFAPQSEIARAAGCAHDVDPRSGAPVAQRDGTGRSSVPEIFIAGDAGGIGGARIAQTQGVLAAAAIAADLGVPAERIADDAVEQARAALRRHRSFQIALWRVHKAPAFVATGGLLCRCEEVDRATIERHLHAGLSSLGAIKRVSRAGMGRCQGRYCGAELQRLVAARTGIPATPDGLFAPRTPFKPIAIADIAHGSLREP